ncbi:MAG: alpha/beta fold hydrolase [Pseudonocardia sp.]|nr:alpha/beta fold hydrolase [Pseudonocardia sp.]
MVMLPPRGLPGLDPAWSRLVTDARGFRWHVLDHGRAVHGTLVCVHGNPTWSYLWRRFVAAAPPGWRVVAVDQLGMGFSQRCPPRTLADRVDDLDAVLTALDVTGPVVTAGHDWGGAVSLGWAVRHRDRLRAVVLANTAVHQPAGAAAPSLIRLARWPALRHAVCGATPTFVRATTALSRPVLPAAVRAAYAAPYAKADQRRAVEGFVADIPLEPAHVSAATLDEIAEEVRKLDDVPALLLWGPRDPVFSDRYLRDLRTRLPHADVQRYERASHLVVEDAPETATDAWVWIGEHVPDRHRDSDDADSQGRTCRNAAADVPTRAQARMTASDGALDLWTALESRAGDPAPAVLEPGPGTRPGPDARPHVDAGVPRPRSGCGRSISWDLLVRRVHELAAGLAEHGVAPGDRVALLVPPGADLTAAAHACWRAGASVVVADPGLGAAGLARALRGAHPAHVVGALPGLTLATALGIPGSRIAAGPVLPGLRRVLGSPVGLATLARRGRVLLDGGAALPVEAAPEDEAAVLFTSGATGPAKGVVYRHRQARAQLAALRAAYGITGDDRLVAAFPPFALYGPALGIPSAVPEARTPGALTAAALARAVAAVDATIVFASPAALRTVVATAGGLTTTQRSTLAGVRRVVSAGAPVPGALLHALRGVLPNAAAHTPYGMTEALPVTDVALADIDAAGPGNGVCVGRPLPGVDVAVVPLAEGGLTREPGVTGEISVAAPHVKDRYDQLWAVQRRSARESGRHRTGDVGHLDAEGRLWVEGRRVHVIDTAAGPVTPVGIEQRVEAIDGIAAAAVVGVGPVGTQQVVVVVVAEPGIAARRPGAPLLAAAPLTGAVRAAAGVSVAGVPVAGVPVGGVPVAGVPVGGVPVGGVPVGGVPVAAVLVADALPVDIRHAAKIDRTRVAAWAGRVLAGERAGRRP